MLPYLSTYMGHSKFAQAAYYIQLIPENIKNSGGIDWQYYIGGATIGRIAYPILYQLLEDYLTFATMYDFSLSPYVSAQSSSDFIP
ncbi:MAG: hypothetical protein NC452_11640 [Eubacterium sp.]|nr:hypothetical protein [Eubacterium sp.]